MVAKAARVKKIQFTCEITDHPGTKVFLIKKCSNPGSGLVIFSHSMSYSYSYLIVNYYFSKINTLNGK